MKWYKQKVYLLFLLSGCVEQKLLEMDEMNALMRNYEDNILNNNQNITQKNKNNNNPISNNNNKASDKQNFIVITFERDKSDLNHNQNTTTINLFLSEVKTSDGITIQATIYQNENENDEICKKRLKAVKEYLSKEIAIERIKTLPNKKSYQKEDDDLYSIICTIVPNSDFKNNVNNPT